MVHTMNVSKRQSHVHVSKTKNQLFHFINKKVSHLFKCRIRNELKKIHCYLKHYWTPNTWANFHLQIVFCWKSSTLEREFKAFWSFLYQWYNTKLFVFENRLINGTENGAFLYTLNWIIREVLIKSGIILQTFKKYECFGIKIVIFVFKITPETLEVYNKSRLNFLKKKFQPNKKKMA